MAKRVTRFEKHEVVRRVSEESILGTMARAQYAAVLGMRWRMLHSIRCARIRASSSYGARVFATGFFLTIWFWRRGVGCGILAASNHRRPSNSSSGASSSLAILTLMWQVVPVILSTALESVELNFMLRFPVSFRSYTLLYLFLRNLRPVVGLRRHLHVGHLDRGRRCSSRVSSLGTTLALGLFALFNFLLTRMIFAWIERWLAQRRTREILGILSLFVFLSFQLLNPNLHSRTGHAPSINQPALALHIR